MAEDTEAAQTEQVTKRQPELKMDCELAISRYIWLKSFEAKFSNERRMKLTRYWNAEDQTIEDYLKKVVETNPSYPLQLIKRAIQSNSLRSLDESLWCLAICLRDCEHEDLKRMVRKDFVELVPSASDLLYFMNHYKLRKLGTKLNLSRGIRSCLEKWYSRKSASELLEMIFATKKVEDIGHSAILRRLRLKFDCDDKNEVVSACFMSYDEIKQNTKNSTTMKKILKYKDLKRSKEVHAVLSILKRKDFNYKVNHLPSIAFKSPEAIELVLPNMSLKEILDNLVDFCSRKMLRANDSVSRSICHALQCSNKIINEAKLNPLHVFEILRTIEKKLIISECPLHKSDASATTAISAAGNDKDKDKKFSNPFIIKKLHHIFSQTLNEQPKTGCRFYVTVDFRKFSKRQSHSFGMNEALCSEVQAILALILLKNEKDVTIMSFTDDRNKLKPVAWNAQTTFDKAMDVYEKEIKEKPKTKENILLPLIKAAEDKKKVDVFITFVSSIGRTAGGRKAKPPLEELESYRKAMKLNMTKVIVINLSRKQSDFVYDEKDINAKGILEIVGFGEDSLKIIEGFAKNCFA